MRGRMQSWTYLDDVLGADAPKNKLRKAMPDSRFWMSPKSVFKH